MKKKAKVLGIVLGIIASTVLLVMISHAAYMKDVVLYNKQFRIEEKNGEYILHFNGEPPEVPTFAPGISVSQDAPHVDFSSMAEMKQDIQSGNFTENELVHIQRFYQKDSKGNVLVCNLNKLYEPISPSSWNMEITNIWWSGLYYSFLLEDHSKNARATVQLYGNREAYEQSKNRQLDLSSLADNPTAIQVQEEDRNATVYKWSNQGVDFKVKTYTIEDGNTLHVYESYSGNIATGNFPLELVSLYGEYQGVFFCVTLTKLKFRPTMDELKAFGIREYVETATE